MRCEYDASKDRLNEIKHGVSLSAAAEMGWDAAIVWTDDRSLYGEKREIAIAPIGNRLYVCVFTDRGAVRRIISLRKANRREFQRYEAEIDSSD